MRKGRPMLDYSEAVSIYESGSSIETVAKIFSVTRQSMWDSLRRRGVAFRKNNPNPFIEFDGLRYSLSKDGYYRCTTFRNVNRMLHQDVWKRFVGPIPDGWEIHHKHHDDKSTVDESRLECLTPSVHTTIHQRERFPMPAPKNCIGCGCVMAQHRHKQRKESPCDYSKRQFCGRARAYVYAKGKPRGK